MSALKPQMLGSHRMSVPDGAQAYTEIVNGEQWLRMLFVWGEGPLELDDFRIEAAECPL